MGIRAVAAVAYREALPALAASAVGGLVAGLVLGGMRAELRAVPWDGTGTVVDAGETWARLDSPAHPDPGTFAGVESDGGVLDGGFPHYEYGGLLGGGTRAELAGTPVGSVSGRTVTWDECTVTANGEPITGVALFCGRDRLGVKLVGRGIDLDVGERVTLGIER